MRINLEQKAQTYNVSDVAFFIFVFEHQMVSVYKMVKRVLIKDFGSQSNKYASVKTAFLFDNLIYACQMGSFNSVVKLPYKNLLLVIKKTTEKHVICHTLYSNLICAELKLFKEVATLF